MHSRSHENSRRLAEYFEGRSVLERTVCGSALKFGVLAAGEADFYPRFGTTMEWDTAAGQAVLEAAGGYVLSLTAGRCNTASPASRTTGFSPGAPSRRGSGRPAPRVPQTMPS